MQPQAKHGRIHESLSPGKALLAEKEILWVLFYMEPGRFDNGPG